MKYWLDFIEDDDIERDFLTELTIGKKELISQLVGLGLPAKDNNIYINNTWNNLHGFPYHASYRKDSNGNCSIECIVGFTGTQSLHSISIAVQPIIIKKK